MTMPLEEIEVEVVVLLTEDSRSCTYEYKVSHVLGAPMWTANYTNLYQS